VPLKIYHGAIWYLKGGWIIQLNENDTLARRRFVLFHEAFHILAHHRAPTVVFKKRECREGSFNELLADHFAGSILMPREWVEKKWAVGEDLDGMAKIFDVPRSLTWLRLREIGLV
jgi:Zn-dependent peptidase ImmA (M78 family)